MIKQFCRFSANMMLCASLLCGCVTAHFTEPITSFHDSINTASVSIGVYYAELNQFEREMYLDGCLYDSSSIVAATDVHGKATPLIGELFGAESIKARTDAIALLGVYAQRLGELAGSDAPQKFQEGAKVLGDNLFNLQTTFEKLGKTESQQTAIDASAKNYSGPIGTIVGVVGKLYLEKRRDTAVTAAITEGAPAVRTVLSLLQKDLTEAVDPLKKTGLKQKLAERVVYYNSNRNVSFDQRRKMLDEIDAAASRYEAALIANPANLVQSMSEAHEALVKYAESPKAPENFAELLSALETFKSHTQEVATAVKQIRDLRKGN